MWQSHADVDTDGNCYCHCLGNSNSNSNSNSDSDPNGNCYTDGNFYRYSQRYGYCHRNGYGGAEGYSVTETSSDTTAPTVRLVDWRSVIVSCFGNSRANLASSCFMPRAGCEYSLLKEIRNVRSETVRVAP